MTLTQVPWGHIEFLFVSVEEWQRECLSKGRDTVHSIQWLVLSQPETYFSNIPTMHFLTVLEPETSCSGGNRSGSDSSRLQGKITCLFQLLWLLAWLIHSSKSFPPFQCFVQCESFSPRMSLKITFVIGLESALIIVDGLISTAPKSF